MFPTTVLATRMNDHASYMRDGHSLTFAAARRKIGSFGAGSFRGDALRHLALRRPHVFDSLHWRKKC